MYFGDPRRRGLPTVRFGGAAIESAAVKTLTETKRICLDFLLNQI